MLAADGYLPPPPELEEYVFNYYSWANAFEPNPAARPLGAGSGSDGNAAAGGILLLTHADTDLLCLEHARARLPDGFPAVTALSLSKMTSSDHMKQVLAEHGRGRAWWWHVCLAACRACPAAGSSWNTRGPTAST